MSSTCSMPRAQSPLDQGRCTHAAILYLDDASLLDAVEVNTAATIEQGHAAIWFATAEHLEQLLNRLGDRGFDCELLRRSGQLTCVDAAKCLTATLQDGKPSMDAFRGIVREVVGQAVRQFNGASVFGEIVNLLWQSGKLDAAHQLEQWWNKIVAEYGISLQCGYRVNIFNESCQTGLDHVCQTHTHVNLSLDDERLDRAVNEALRITFMDADVIALRQVLLDRFPHQSHVPAAQAVLIALHQILPNVAHDVRMLARDFYNGQTPLTG